MRYWPLGSGRIITSPFGPRPGEFHTGVDFGFPGGSGNQPVYAIDGGRVLYAGAAQGYGGPDPAGWLVVLADDGTCWEYGHVLRRANVGQRVEAGQIIAVINPSSASNGGVAPHLHLSLMPNGYNSATKQDPMPRLAGARDPDKPVPPITKEPIVGDPVWLPDVLRAEGLRCDIYPGAFERGHGDFGDIWGVLCHHTGSFGETPRGIAEHPSLGLASQLYLSRDGVYTLCGVGVAWHAGNGSYPGVGTNNGNQKLIGIEAANDGGGTPGKPHRSSWSDVQYDAYVRGVAAILRKLGQPASHAIGHKEWAGAAQGKWDPGAIDMNIFRGDVAARLTAPGGEDMAAVPQAEWAEALDLLRQVAKFRRKSRSPFRWPGEGEVDTIAGFAWWSDANIHVQLIEKLAVEYGDPGAVSTLVAVAKMADEPGKFPDRQADAKLAARILAKVDPESRTVGEAQIRAWLAAEKS